MVKEVIIVGAGVAGLAAAHTLIQQHGLHPDDIEILEASQRIGGRLQTESVAGTAYDFGGTWIHGTQGHAFIDLAAEHGIVIKEISTENPWLHPRSDTFTICDGQYRYTESDVAQGFRSFKAIVKQVQERSKASDANSNICVQGVFDDMIRDFSFERDDEKRIVLLGLALIEIWMGCSLASLQLNEFREIDFMG